MSRTEATCAESETSAVRKLDDHYFESRLSPLLAAYRADLEKEGRPLAFGDALGDGNLNPAHHRIVKIKDATGLRAAQVANVTTEKDDLMNIPTGTSHKSTFLRWAHAESMPFLDDAPTVEASAVRNAPLGDVLAHPHASDDGTDAAVGE